MIISEISSMELSRYVLDLLTHKSKPTTDVKNELKNFHGEQRCTITSTFYLPVDCLMTLLTILASSVGGLLKTDSFTSSGTYQARML